MEEKEYCKNMAEYRFTWPGQKEKVVCRDCAAKISFLAKNIGINLYFYSLDEIRSNCTQPRELEK